jgi:hypothetical protein
MSDVNFEQENQDRLASLYTSLLINVAVSGLGAMLFNIDWLGAMRSSSPLMIIGILLIGAPLLVKWFVTRSFGGLFKMSEYEVVTTYSDGSRKSDGGSESRMNNLILTVIIAGIMIVVALIIQPIRIVIMTIKCATLTRKVKVKPPFIKRGIFLFLAYLVLGAAGLVIGGAIQYTRNVAREKEKQANAAFAEAPWAGRTAKVSFAGDVNLRAEANGQSRIVKTLKQGDQVTLTNDSDGFWAPVSHEGTNGWVFGLNLRFTDRDVAAWRVEVPFIAVVVEPVEVSLHNINYTLEAETEIRVYRANRDFTFYTVKPHPQILADNPTYPADYNQFPLALSGNDLERLRYVRTDKQ